MIEVCKLTRNVDQEILIIALKGTEDELKEKYLFMSQRAAANIKDEIGSWTSKPTSTRGPKSCVCCQNNV